MAKKLKSIKLYEEFTESKNYLMRKYFDKLAKDIKEWFTTGSLSAEGLEFVNLDKDGQSMGTTRTLMLEFKDMEFSYTVIVLLDHSMFEENEIKKCYLTVKRYNEGEILDIEEEPDLDIDSLTEDYIISKIGEMKDKDMGIEPEKKEETDEVQEEPAEETEETGIGETDTTSGEEDRDHTENKF